MKTKSKFSGYILRRSVAAVFVSFVIVALSSAINLANHPPKAPVPQNDPALGVNGHEGAASPPPILKNRALTFADRVAYQRAIEEVYWRHRIWPKANAGPKPPLDKVMSQREIEKKVEDYLRNSQALEDYWQRQITPDQLQAEMKRIASHTKQPGVLREIFDALGNDPFVIAECLARPVLAERLLTELYARDQRFHGELKRCAEAELRTHRSIREIKQTSGMYTEMEWIKSDAVVDNSARADAKNVEGVKMNASEWQDSVEKLAAQLQGQSIVGQAPRLPNRGLAAGAATLGVRRHVAAFESADMSAHSKNAGDEYKTLPVGKLSPLQEDDAHYYAVAVMRKSKDRLKLATIAWLKEPLRSWLAKAETQVPETMAAVVSTSYTLPQISGTSDSSIPSGGCTDDTWTATISAPDGRALHTAIWTGTEMIVWGGCSGPGCGSYFNTGGRYDPSTDSWTPTNMTNAPTARAYHTAVWTGSEMIVWGGWDGSSVFNTGGKYNPGTDSWTPTGTTNVPTARFQHTAVWTGNEMIVWGGEDANGEASTGGRYNPSTDSWTATSTTNAPADRALHTAVWTGSQMIVWGGFRNGGFTYLNTGGRYSPSTDSWTLTSTPALAGRYAHTAVWTGSQMVVWGGTDLTTYFNTGGRYTPSTDSWTVTSTGTNVPAGRAFHTAVWSGSEMIVWSGFDDTNYFNTGGRYNPTSDSWAVTSTSNTPAARGYHTAVWTGTEMIVWGGDFYDGTQHYLNTGGRYNPSTDSWTATTNNNVPDGRYYHTAVWTGSEMIVWGGNNGPYLNTGGRYNPSTDSWTATSTTNAPAARGYHTAVWTGTLMIIWGGYNGSYLNTGGQYNPSTDSWTATSTSNAPAGRVYHTAVWTGTEMIVWGGGLLGNTVFNTGGRYNPSTDSWTATSTTNAPAARELHTAVWTGTEMVVWGGFDFSTGDFNTGGKYYPSTDSWIATSITNAPTARGYHTAVWTGSEMIVWGGYDGSSSLNSGGRYNPSTDAWIAVSPANAPTARIYHTAVWTGSEMIVWGGAFYNNGSYNYLNSGGRYNPSTDSWIATSNTNAPDARGYHTAVWTGTQLIVWGGANGSSVLNSGGRYCAQPPPCTDDTWTGTSITNVPASRYTHTAVWTGSEMIVWGGYDGTSYFNTGGRYNPTTDTWTATSTGLNVPAARGVHTAVWTGSQMIVWGGYFYDGSSHFLNTGGRYDPSTDSWNATSITNAPDGRDYHTAVWTGSEMIVWGGNNGPYLNTGGKYDPSTDSWTATSITNAPAGRNFHTAVWTTGNEMIIWGGSNGSYLNTGGRYDSSTDSWTATTTSGAPSGRAFHTAVWTGSEMIIWGGQVSFSYFNTGGRYDPNSDSWTATTTASAPVARAHHTAVWNGNQMIVWGGQASINYLNTGGRYDPNSDSWTATTTTAAPAGRPYHTAVWTDSQMIVWGGYNGNYFNTGGRYCAAVPSPTPTPTATATATATATFTPTPTPTATATATATATSTPTPTATPTPTVTATVQVTVKTNPANLSFTVDGITYNSTHRFSWVPGSSHTISTTSPQGGGTGVQYVWSKWSDHGAISHTVAPTINTTYTATFSTQYFLTMTAGTGGTVSPRSGWKKSGTIVSITATPANGYSFSNWTGTGTGSYSGPNNPASITMGGPIMETATFIHN